MKRALKLTTYELWGNTWLSHSGLNYYDNVARLHDPLLLHFGTPDSRYYNYAHFSPWSHCGANPINIVDPTGNDIVVLVEEDSVTGHMAMLIQNEEGNWQLYSINGDTMYELSFKKFGRPFDFVGMGNWDSPEAFFEQLRKENKNRNKADRADDSKIFSNYTAGYQIKTTPTQDAIMRNSFKGYSNKVYLLLWNNCAQAVQEVMMAAGLPISGVYEYTYSPYPSDFFIVVDVYSRQFRVTNEKKRLPKEAFRNIVEANRYGWFVR